jgi:hypothetical protein
MEQQNNWPLRLQQALIKALEEACGSKWGYNVTNNWGLEADMVEEFDKMPVDRLSLVKREVTPEGIQMYVSVGSAITSLQEITNAVYQLLRAVGERFLVFLPMLDDEFLKYWFVVGTVTHGHIGEVIIPRGSVSHIDVSILDTTVSWEQYITKSPDAPS